MVSHLMFHQWPRWFGVNSMSGSGRRSKWCSRRRDEKPAAEAYDLDAFRAALAAQNGVPVIPSNGSRAQNLPYDTERYKARSEIECTFALIKQARRFATRYEKTLRNYAAVVAIGCAVLWLRI